MKKMTFTGTRPSSNEAHHIMGEGSARFHPKRGMKCRGQRQPERGIRTKRMQYTGILQSSSDEIDRRIHALTCEIKVSPTRLSQEIRRNPLSLRVCTFISGAISQAFSGTCKVASCADRLGSDSHACGY
ncbi:unnamed protein product [Protopolystoma xenopodis]|uniref:Uncharacterized protein n=1 Tax=Protopolystoma xenopodis TaxID=117903 RepID=A0A448XNE8_9PLAT|nr:unnamed protein product [Protopolystoma xenopodis]